ncbi:hypothetical protein COOONC_15718, partial [Cooperia oncophora]
LVSDEDERAQKNTFTRWINLHLEEHSSSGRVNDLFEDIKDGVLLCHLIEVLTGEALPVKFACEKRCFEGKQATFKKAGNTRGALQLMVFQF